VIAKLNVLVFEILSMSTCQSRVRGLCMYMVLHMMILKMTIIIKGDQHIIYEKTNTLDERNIMK